MHSAQEKPKQSLRLRHNGNVEFAFKRRDVLGYRPTIAGNIDCVGGLPRNLRFDRVDEVTGLDDIRFDFVRNDLNNFKAIVP